MSALLSFIIGLILGGVIGFFAMCLFQLNNNCISFKVSKEKSKYIRVSKCHLARKCAIWHFFYFIPIHFGQKADIPLWFAGFCYINQRR